MTFDLRHTSFIQGMLDGTGAEYGGKFDGFVALNTDGAGLWDGGAIRTHLEYRHGSAPTNLGGAIFAVNTGLYWPVNSPDRMVATSLYFSQRIGSDATIAVGKINPVDLLASDNFYGGWGIERFMNIVFVAEPSGLIPVVFIGGVGTLKTKALDITLMVYDPDDRTNDYFPGDVFQNGVNIYLSGAHRTMLGGRQTTFIISGLYSTAAGVDYSSIAPGLETTTKSGAYNLNVEFRHNLQELPGDAKTAWGFNLKLAVADGNPNYVQSSIIIGIGGAPLFFGRPQDSFGLAAFHYNFSDELQDTLSGTTKFGDEDGIETYYDYALFPWLSLTADLQYIRPASGNFDDFVVATLRTRIKF